MKKYISIIVVLAAVVVGFGYFALFSTPAAEISSELAAEREAATSAGVAAETAPEPRQGTGSLEALRLMGENLECTISYTDPEQGSTVEGTYFVADGDMRGDFLTDSPDLSGQVLSSMIVTQDMMYVWSEIDGQAYGMKVNLATAQQNETSSFAAREPVDRNAAVEYDCKPWPNVDWTVFEPPSTVLFQDMNELMQAGMEYGTVYEGAEMPIMPEGFEIPVQ